jgi:nitrite reductase (NO-forming)
MFCPVRPTALLLFTLVGVSPAVSAQASALSVDTAVLSYAPRVPPPLTRRRPSRIVVILEAEERVGHLDAGIDYPLWTFGGQVPGGFLRVRQGDLVEFHLRNHPANRMPHNVDLHAVTGPGGGAAGSLVPPGHEAVFEFQAATPGLYVYHCATAPVGMHIANGMYGLVLVEPPGGLRPVDHEFYIMQGEFYTDSVFGEPGLRRFSMEKALAERPDYVVFNGGVGTLVGPGALTAHVGQSVRLFFGNAGPNLAASLHLTGEVFDRVFPDGGQSPMVGMQTLAVPPGGAVIAEFAVDVPGTYTLVDHAVFRAFNKGAIGNLRVDGPPNPRIYAGLVSEEVYLLEGGVIQTLPTRADSAARALTLAERMERGRRVYGRTCIACHQANGQGIPGTFPPLAGSDFLNDNPRRAIGIVLNGLTGPVVVKGRTYNAVMPALRLGDDDIADVLTYVLSQWGNSSAVVTREEVRHARLCPWCDGTVPMPR